MRLRRPGAGVYSRQNIDEYACRTYEANFHEHPSGDITKIDAESIPEFEILTAGFPCQPFSIIGSLDGFSDTARGNMFFEILRILQLRRPMAFMLENVKNLAAHDKGRTYSIIMNSLEKSGSMSVYLMRLITACLRNVRE